MADDGDQEIAWRAMPRKTAVVDAAGNQIGVTAEVLADDAKDIFHGLAVKLSSSGKVVEVQADRIPKITRGRVYTSLQPSELGGLRVISD
jgi:hypothetical protein